MVCRLFAEYIALFHCILTIYSVFEHQISGRSQFTLPHISAGGILADVMGLGKTLTVLSAIVHSMEEACHFILPSDETSVNDHLAYPTKATLVVVPSARKCGHMSRDNDWEKLNLLELIEVWKSEIARCIIQNSPQSIVTDCAISHIAKDYLNVATFHGNDRGNEPQAFASSDLVLTTYSTLVKDHQNAGVLRRLKWFRVVLDEGKINKILCHKEIEPRNSDVELNLVQHTGFEIKKLNSSALLTRYKQTEDGVSRELRFKIG